jgi:hypothetical protein
MRNQMIAVFATLGALLGMLAIEIGADEFRKAR